ncbi:CBN-INX-3 protein [Aphelenchoides avenae]|nr:CBN-INX-3 protein [Aphelenchus avenae]
MGHPRSFYPDCVDRLNGYITPMILIFCLSINTAALNGWIEGQAMACLKPPELKEDEIEWAMDYCTSKNHYYVSPQDQIPFADYERVASQLGYYHWVPITLLVQALFFIVPSLLWNYACTSTGINFPGLLSFAKEINRKCASQLLTHPDRPKLIDQLAAEIHATVVQRRSSRRSAGFRLGYNTDSYACTLYLGVKLLYVGNVVAQFYLLNAFIGHAWTWWGWDVLQSLISGQNWQDSSVFPRLTLCDVYIRRMSDVQRASIQCHLRMNTYNEKFYFVIWWLLAGLALTTLANFAYYVFLFSWPWTREATVRNLVTDRRHRDVMWSPQMAHHEMVEDFADVGLRNDGILLMWFIQEHATTTLARDTMSRIFDNYRWFRDNGDKPAPAGIAYDTLGGAQVTTAAPRNRKPTAPTASNAADDWATPSVGFANQVDDDDQAQEEDQPARDGDAVTSDWSAPRSSLRGGRGRGRRGAW